MTGKSHNDIFYAQITQFAWKTETKRENIFQPVAPEISNPESVKTA